MTVANQRDPFVRAHDLLMLAHRARRKIIHHLLAGEGIFAGDVIEVVTGCAVDGPDFDALLSRLDDQLLEGVDLVRVGAMPTVKHLQVVKQVFAHLAGFEKTVQICLMQVGQQVLHVQRFDVLLRQQRQVIDDHFLAGDGKVRLADHDAVGVAIKRFKQLRQTRLRGDGRQGRARRQLRR